MKRREFTAFALSIIALTPLKSQAYFLEKLIGKTSPEYIREYFSRMWNWYKLNFFDFSKNFNGLEKELIESWKAQLNSWGVEIDKDFYRDSFSFIHSVKNNKVNHSGFCCTQKKWSEDQLSLLKKVLKQKRIDLKSQDIFTNLSGIEWNFEDGLITLYYKAGKAINYISFKGSLKYDSGQILITKEYKEPLELMIKEDILAVHKITSELREPRYHFRFKAFYVPFLSKPAFDISKRHFKEFHQPIDSIEIVDKNEYRIFYP